jgi:methionyl-tRNA synthetase
LPKAIYVHGFVTANGEKMSKSIGNVVDPVAMVEKYGTDVVRYFLLREIPSDEDGDFSEEKLIARYNGDLANGLGNLVQRVVTLISNNLDGEILFDSNDIREEDKKFLDLRDYFDLDKIDNYINNFQLHKVLEYIWFNLAFIDYYINEKQPWAEVKNNKEEFKKTMLMLVRMIYRISSLLWPFMPETADKISEIFDFKKESAGLEGRRLKVRKSGVLFPRL